MGYYGGGDYYGAGDYYAAGGLFGFLGKVAKGVAGTALGIGKAALAASPVGQAATAVSRAILPTGPAAPEQMPVIMPPQMQVPKSPIPVARTPYLGLPVTGAGLYKPKRKRMNYGNTKALRRADRRIEGFVKVARSALRHTGYKVVSKSAGAGRGSRGVITRSEAARALRR